MKVWTYAEMSTKVLTDLDLLDKAMVGDNELIGYFNEAVLEAESEIITLNQDYFITMGILPVVAGTARYALPPSIFANRIRCIMYINGTNIYEIVQYRRKGKFREIAFTELSGQADDYRYVLYNDVPGQAQIEFHPTLRDTAIIAPVASIFKPVQIYYLRNCKRIPIIGEYANLEVIATAQVSGSTIQTYAGSATIGVHQQWVPGSTPGSIAYITGDAVKFTVGPGGTLPSPLVAGTVYYVILGVGGLITLATTQANAFSGVAITLTTVGTVLFTMQVAATTAIQQATYIDIPEFSTFVMQWVKCRCYEKDGGDPRLSGAIATLAQQKQQMIDTLVKSIDDDDDVIQMDFSSYNEMS